MSFQDSMNREQRVVRSVVPPLLVCLGVRREPDGQGQPR